MGSSLLWKTKIRRKSLRLTWFEELDQLNSEPFLIDREQPVTPERRIFN